MHKEKSKKSERAYMDFPAGTWTISFGLATMNNYPWAMGLINLIETEDPDRKYVGAIQFNEKVNIVDNTPFPLYVDFHHEDGAIHFHILGATKDFDQNAPLPPQYHFKFDGICKVENNETVLSGTGGVPSAFCPRLGGPDADGDNVIWRSGGPTDPPHKPSN
jgi:hypothetical protein